MKLMADDLGVLVDPVDRHPLMFVTQDLEGVENLSEGCVEVFVHDHHVQILFVLSLKHRRLLHLIDQLIILKIFND